MQKTSRLKKSSAFWTARSRIPNLIRITGPFCVEATIPTPVGWDKDDPSDDTEGDNGGSFLDRMLEILRRSPLLQLGAGKTVSAPQCPTTSQIIVAIRRGRVEGDARGGPIGFGDALDAADERNLGTLPFSQKPVALVFGPENGAISETLGFRGGPRGARQELHASLRDRLRYSAELDLLRKVESSQ